MPLPAAVLPIALTAASALSGYLGGRNRTRGSTTPTFDPTFAPLRDILLRNSQRALGQGYRLPTAFRSAGISDINATSDASRANIDAELTSRGLGASPAAVPAIAGAETNRRAAINRFETVDIPEIEYGREQDEANRALAILGMGRGTQSTMEGTEGGGAGGALDGIGEILGFMMAMRARGTPINLGGGGTAGAGAGGSASGSVRF